MFERFTDRARKVMALSNQEAHRLGHAYIGTEHLLLGLVLEGSGMGANVIKSFDVELRKVRLEVEKITKNGVESLAGKPPQTPRAKKVIEYALLEARDFKHGHIGTEHILLGLLKEEGGVAYTALSIVGLSYEKARQRTIELLAEGWVDSSDTKADAGGIAALRALLPGHGPENIRPNEGGAFKVKVVGSGAMVIHSLLSQINLTSEDLTKNANSQAAAVMRSVADQLEKGAAELRQAAERLAK